MVNLVLEKWIFISYKKMTFESANLLKSKHKSYRWIPLNALFPSMFLLLFVKEQIINSLEVQSTLYKCYTYKC